MPRHYTLTGGRALRRAAEIIGGEREKLMEYMVEAEQTNIRRALEVAEELSSGTLSEEYLRDVRPFSKQYWATPPVPSFIINRHTWAFFNGWRASKSKIQGNEVLTRLTNVSEHARHILDISPANPYSHQRPLMDRVRQRTAYFVGRTRREAIARALGEDGQP